MLSSFPVASLWCLTSSIVGVRVGTGHLDFVRVAFDLEGEPNPEVREEKSRILVRLGLEDHSPSRKVKEKRVGFPPVEAVRWTRREAEIVLEGPVRFRHFLLRQPWRLVVDLRRPEGYARLSQGVEWKRERTSGVVVNVLAVDPGLAEVRPALAGEWLRGRAPVGEMAEREGALAAVNGGYFDPGSGMPLGMLVLFGEWLRTPDVGRSALLLYPEGRAEVKRCRFVGAVRVGEVLFPLEGINVPHPSDEAVAAYNRRYGQKCPWSKVGATRVVVEKGLVREVVLASRAIPIPKEGWVLCATGRLGWRMAKEAREGKKVEFHLRLEPEVGEVLHARGAGPMLIEGGKVVVEEAIKVEGIGPQAQRRRARTAVAVDAEGRLLLVAVERLPDWSEGATLFELAKILSRLGAVNAMNLDGGGSTMMFARGERLVEPERGEERPVTDAILVLPRPPRKASDERGYNRL